MAPGFNTLKEDDDGYDSAEDLDFSDLRQQYDVRLEQGLDSFVVVDGLPIVEASNKAKLQKFVTGKLSTSAFKIKPEGFYMPMGANGKSEGYAFVEYETPQQALKACKTVHGTPVDKRHTFGVNRITDIERYGREGRIEDEYDPPIIEEFKEKEHLRWWLGDPNCRDQYALYRADSVAINWNRKKEVAETIVERQHWTEKFLNWSPLGTYLATMHMKGIQLWGGPSWTRQARFVHPWVDLVDFSPSEKYVCTWSYKPIEVAEDDPILTEDEDGKNYIIWDMDTERPLRSFNMYDLPTAPIGPEGQPVKKQLPWPTFKWSADDKYVARMKEGEGVYVYELPSMKLMDKKQIPIEGILDFEWSPATPQREGMKVYEQLFCYWTPEIGSNPAKVGLMSIPSKEIVRTRNLFNVTDAKLHWQSQASYVCVKVDRHSKSKKSLATNLEIFRVREKGVPVEVVDSLKDTVINFAWEPKGDRFVLITTGEVVMTTAVPPKTSVSFFCPEKIKGGGVGNYKLIKTNEKKNNNSIFWSPKGRFCVVATVLSQQSFDLDFWDFDYEGETHEQSKDLTANLQLMNTAEHYGVTEVAWDPTGRYVTTGASSWKHNMENGFHLYDFKGDLLREEPLEKFKQLLWRPRPATLLSKDEQKLIRKNLREYSKDFEEQDRIEEDKEKGAIVEQRRRVLSEWIAWLERERETLSDERKDLGLDVEEKEEEEEKGEKVVEEIVEEVLDEVEEIV